MYIHTLIYIYIYEYCDPPPKSGMIFLDKISAIFINDLKHCHCFTTASFFWPIILQ